MVPMWTGIVFGSAFILGAILFYCTMRGQSCYEDSDVPVIQISR